MDATGEARVIAIDGPSASGKSTVARRVAEALGALYVDTGAVYRGITWAVLRAGAPTDDGAAVVRAMQAIRFDFHVDAGAVGFRIDGVDPGDAIRSPEVNHHVSPVSAVPEVREQVVAWLRKTAELGDLVMEGRDIGTVVFPAARWKFYLDASPEARAERRHRETQGTRHAQALEATEESLRRRDAIDTSRKTAPLRVAPGARVIDTTGMTADDVVAAVLAAVRGQSEAQNAEEADTIGE